ncbi:DMT family transporter [Aromatoleum petrolei]|uniref:EamA family transporter n=1 Tax=Aromatoleum petrolei TaxID=76116 RepID=A0ABX1MPP8_9RHOO|nr:EamA family transporter [Aromatoleum petrolei]NMF87969.1 EamA family transporter [Aromatoleum petrolei]QTQ36662.1 EamA domain-containing protein [Aromatoleum petrolei]
MKSDLQALSAIALWSVLAFLAVELAHLPPFLLTGVGLLLGSLIALPLSRFRFAAWKIPLPTLLLGVYGLFGFHLLLFLALRSAPVVEANLINYLWPLGMVLLAPAILPGTRLRAAHLGAATLGFAGAAIAILGGKTGADVADGAFHPGYVLALGSALIWATYSLGTRRVAPFETAAVGSFAALSGVLSLICHALFEPAATLTARDLASLALLGAGPLGGAFFLWDAALKKGDPRRIAVFAFLTPLLSTVVLVTATGQPLQPNIALAAAMIIAAAEWGRRATRS